MRTLLPLTHPDIQRRIALGTAAGNRALVLEHESQFLTGHDRNQRRDAARLQTMMAQHHFIHAHRHADHSEPEVRLSQATMDIFAAARAAEKAAPVTHPGKGAHWAAKRAAKAA